MPELRATARLQLHSGFDLAAASAQVPYYAALGVSHLYLSPIAAARAGSTHGYDVIDPQRINPELGGEPAFRALVDALRRHGMGVIVDIVPNHMAADTANPWWRDVLAHGRNSAYAGFFDIDWSAPESEGRLWLPILGRSLAESIAAGDIGLAIDPHDGLPALACPGHRLPLARESLLLLASKFGLAAGADLLDPVAWRGVERPLAVSPGTLAELATRQHYRLAHWRSGNDVVNYRRFFDITELVALAVERSQVFDAVHALPLRLIAQGLIDGLRIDHVDGLSDPRGYLRRLRRAMDRAAAARSTESREPISLHVEKILASGEALRADWPVDGSTGYDFMDQAGAVLHDARGAPVLRRAWHVVSGRPAGFGEEEDAARMELIDTSLHAEFAGCARAWHALAQREAAGRDLSVHAIARALAEVLQQLRVYRTYRGPCAAAETDRRSLQHAFDAADRHGEPDRQDARDFLRQALLDAAPRRTSTGAARAALRLAYRRFEQTAAPLNAKAVEDTGFYRHGVLLSRNEVGSDPRDFALAPAAFHCQMQARASRWPRALLALATHDHKRGPDTRARLAVLGERADAFAEQARCWIDRLHAHNALPTAGDLWMLLQTVLAAWPLGLMPHDHGGIHDFAARLAAWQLKALREAKLATRWTAPNEAYESACASQLHDLLGGGELAALREELAEAARRLDAPGALNGLAMATLQLTAPGVPDLYQGSEFWDQSLVDPDNRRPVDYGARRTALAQAAEPAALLRGFRDGRIKQWLTTRLLLLRRQYPELLLHGDYTPLAVQGEAADRALAFVRRARSGGACVVVVPRLCADWLADHALPCVPASCWGDTHVRWPDDIASTCHDVLLDRTLEIAQGVLRLDAALASWPVAVLHVA